jgi:hypothetical protein
MVKATTVHTPRRRAFIRWIIGRAGQILNPHCWAGGEREARGEDYVLLADFLGKTLPQKNPEREA